MSDNTSSSDSSRLLEFIASRPWLCVWLGFVLLLGAWCVLVYLAYHYQPESVPLVMPEPAAR